MKKKNKIQPAMAFSFNSKTEHMFFFKKKGGTMHFDLDLYKPTELEKRISYIYRENGILSPSHMDLDKIAFIYDCHVIYSEKPTMVLYDDAYGGLIFLNACVTKEQQREDFFHEISHPALHVGCQNTLPELFVDLQESQAASFQLYSAMPYFMLAAIEPSGYENEYISQLSDIFQLSFDFVNRRIEQVHRRIVQGYHDRNTQFRFNNTNPQDHEIQLSIARTIIL